MTRYEYRKQRIKVIATAIRNIADLQGLPLFDEVAMAIAVFDALYPPEEKP